MAGPGGRRGGVRALALGAVLLALAACEPLSREEFRCEEAMARVLHCCPAVERSPVACVYGESDLGPNVWTFPEVDCIVGKSCEALVEGGVCAWAETGGVTAVCP